MKIDWVYWMPIIACVLTVGFCFYTINYKCESCESCIMLDKTADYGINGYYSPGKYYCVWTDSRTYEEINKTEYHEVCHHLIYKDYKHFCD